jgi:hypothetical protein
MEEKSIKLTKSDYKPEEIGYRNCRNCIGKRVEYTIKYKREGGRFLHVSDETGLCQECYNKLPG